MGIAIDGAGEIFAGGFYLGGGEESTVGNWTPPDCGSAVEGGFNGTEQQPAVDGWGQVFYIGNGILAQCGGQIGLVGTAATPVKGHQKLATKAKPQLGGNTGSFDFSGTADSLAMDPQGNIWVADSGNNAVKEVLASSGFAISQVVGSGFNNPESVASDAFGNIFVNDAGNGAIKEMTASSGYTTILTVASIPVNKTFTNDNLSVDAQGNVYWPNQSASSNGLGVVEKLDFSDAPALVFPTSTKVGAKDTADGTMTATVNNSGNAPLTISALTIAGNSFQIDSSATTCSALTTLAVGGSCTVGVFFEPNAVGAVTGTLTVMDNALNANGATQTFALSGTGFITPTTAQPTVTVTPAANSINTTQTLSVTITVAGKNPTPVPTGVVTLSSGSYSSATTTLVGGTATITVPAGALAAGSDTLTAIYAPDQAASTAYSDGAGFGAVTVTAAAKSTPTVTVTSSPATVTIAQEFSVMVTVAGWREQSDADRYCVAAERRVFVGAGSAEQWQRDDSGSGEDSGRGRGYADGELCAGHDERGELQQRNGICDGDGAADREDGTHACCYAESEQDISEAGANGGCIAERGVGQSFADRHGDADGRWVHVGGDHAEWRGCVDSDSGRVALAWQRHSDGKLHAGLCGFRFVYDFDGHESGDGQFSG